MPATPACGHFAVRAACGAAGLLLLLLGACGFRGGEDGGDSAGVQIMPDALPPATAGQPYRVELMLAGGATPVCQVVADTLPDGLLLSFRSCDTVAVISGTPRRAASCSFTVTASCFGTNEHGAVGARAYTLVIR